MRFIFALFIIIPIIEMWGLIKVGSWLGAGATVFLVFLTAMVGIALLKRQGASTLLRAQQRSAQGEIPIQEVVEGVFFAVGGALLLTPGFFTDFIGFCCLIPGLRQLIIAWGLKNISAIGPGAPGFGFSAGGQSNSFSFSSSFESQTGGVDNRASSASSATEGQVIDGEYSREAKPTDKLVK